VDADNKPVDPKPIHSKSAAPDDDALLPNSAADDFFVKMNRDFRRPKPSQEAVAAALQAIQTLAGDAAENEAESTFTDSAFADPTGDRAADRREDLHSETTGERCPKCRAVNSSSNRFCGFCGSSLLRREKPIAAPVASLREQPVRDHQAPPQAREQHVHHHHHHYFPESLSVARHSFGEMKTALRGELAAPATDEAAAEAAIQKLVTDWTLCCNSRRLDDLVALYSADAIVLRANLAPAHGRTAIHQLLQAALQAGLGDVELEPADAGVLGDIACLTGKSRMLVPTAPGKRHEETGKFLIVARRESGGWKILADSWCIDSPQQAPAAAETPVVTPRTPRK